MVKFTVFVRLFFLSLPNIMHLWYTKITDMLCSGRGVEQLINGTDRVIVPVRLKSFNGIYEPLAWRILMSEVRQGDTAVDVGACIGVYSVALAKRVGLSGKVVAFEPDHYNYQRLKWVIDVNGVSGRVEPFAQAVTSYDGKVRFIRGLLNISRINSESRRHDCFVPCVRLDTVFSGRRIDILKIDVEGYEEEVIKGCQEILADPRRRPRCILVEAHRYFWPETGTTMESLLERLKMYKFQEVGMDNIKDRFDKWRSGIICTAQE